MDYRAITSADVGAVSRLAVQALDTAGEYPVHVDLRKIRASVTFFAEQGAGHFQMAAFDGDTPVAAVAAVVQEMPFFERCEAHVVMCFSTSAGAGMRLLRALISWFKADMRIRRLVWAMNCQYDERLRLVAKRLGFKQECPMFVNYKE